MSRLQFSKFDSKFEISDPKNFQIPSCMQIKLYFAISVHHIGSAILNNCSLTSNLKSATRKNSKYRVLKNFEKFRV